MQDTPVVTELTPQRGANLGVPGLPGLGREAAASPSTGVEESQGVLKATRPVGLGMCAPDVIMGGAFTA